MKNTTSKQNRLYRLLAAGGVLLLLAAVFVQQGYWPFGANSLMTGDMNGQYIPFYAHFYRALHSGTGSLFYAQEISLGGGAFALFAYYFASPFAWLYLLVPPVYYGQLCSVIYAAKIMLAAVAVLWYWQKKYETGSVLWVPLAWCYALMGFSVAYAQNIMWLDAVILLPLVCRGIDRIRQGKGGAGFALALAPAILTNFYMGYMLCLFSVLYYVYGILAEPADSLRILARRTAKFACGGICAAALSGVILVPTVAELSGVKNNEFSLSAGTEFSLPMLVQRFFTGNFVWADVQQGLPYLYCGMLGLLALILYFTAALPLRKKLCAAGLLAVLTLSLWWTPLNLIWHGMAKANWFPYRQSFVVVFFILLLGAEGLRAGHTRRGWAVSAAVCAALAAFVLVFRAETYGRRRWLVAAVVLGVLLAGVWLYRRAEKPRAKQLLAAALVLAAGAELCLNACWCFAGFEKYPVSAYAAFVAQGTQTVEALREQDGGNYRVEKTFYRTLNDPLLLGYRGMTHFSSTQNNEATTLEVALGYCSFGSCYGYFSGSTAAADSLLGIRYYLNDGSQTPPLHFAPAKAENTAWNVSENENALPLALLADESLAGLTLDQSDTFAAQNTLYTALAGHTATLFTEFAADADSGAAYQLTVPADGIVYAVFCGGAADVPLQVNGADKGNIFSVTRSSGAAVELGRFCAGDTVSVSLGESADSARFAVLDENALAAVCGEIRDSAPEQLDWRDGWIELRVSAAQSGLAVLTVPYDKNWQVTVNGARTATTEAAGTMLAAMVPAGESTVTFTYHQPGMTAGVILTLCGLGGLAGILVQDRKGRKRA